MAPTKFVNFLAVVSFAVFCISHNSISANALAVERAHVARNLNYAHAGIAKKKRDSSKRCKPRPSTSSPHHTSTPPSTSSHHTSNSPSHTPSTTSTHPSSSPPATHTSSSPTHSPSATTVVSSGSNKVGLGWSNNEQSSICDYKTDQTGLVYNWKLTKYPDVDVSKCGFEFIPTVWGSNDAYQVPSILKAGYAKRVFAFNEPELSSQSNLDVNYAIQLYKEFINPLQYSGYQLISPSCTNSPTGLAWIQAFVKGCREQGCKIDGVGTHYYDVSADRFIQYMEKFTAYFSGDEVWVTEFAAQDYSGNNQQLDYNQIKDFLAKTTSYMQGKAQIRAYFYFGAMQGWELSQNHVNELNSLMGGNNAPNQLGEMYINP